MRRTFRLIGASLIFLSTIGSILYNIRSCNDWMGNLFWQDQREGMQKLSSLGNGYNHRTLSEATDKRAFHTWIKLLKEFSPYETFKGITEIESKTILNYATRLDQPAVPIISAPISLLYGNKDLDHAITTLPVLREWLRNREDSEFYRAVLFLFLLGLIMEFLGRERLARVKQNQKSGTRLLFAVIALLLICFFMGSYSWMKESNLSLFGVPWLCGAVLLISGYAFTAWFFIKKEDENDRDQSIDVQDNDKEAHLAKYDHVHEEITRYRDLVWQIAVLTWGIYYGLTWLADEDHKFSYLPEKVYFASIFLAAGLSTIFLLFCEHNTIKNKRQRRELEENLKVSPRWRHTPDGESTKRLGFRFSVFTFLLAIWLPALFLLVFRK